MRAPSPLVLRWFLLLGALLAPLAAQQPKRPKAGAAVDILFVGNSYTFYNDLPAMVAALGQADTPPRVVTTTMLAPGGCSLQRHWQATGKDAPREVLKDKRPDFVVLQEQSRMPLDQPKVMHEHAAKFARLLKEQKVVPVWYMTWARQAEPEAQDRITAAYEKAHLDGGGLLAPVGRAFQVALGEKDAPRLHVDDGSHPNASGSYLAAVVLYATMCGGDVGTCPDKLVLRLADGKERVLCDLPAEEGKRLRAAASAVLGKTK